MNNDWSQQNSIISRFIQFILSQDMVLYFYEYKCHIYVYNIKPHDALWVCQYYVAYKIFFSESDLFLNFVTFFAPTRIKFWYVQQQNNSCKKYVNSCKKYVSLLQLNMHQVDCTKSTLHQVVILRCKIPKFIL